MVHVRYHHPSNFSVSMTDNSMTDLTSDAVVDNITQA